MVVALLAAGLVLVSRGHIVVGATVQGIAVAALAVAVLLSRYAGRRQRASVVAPPAALPAAVVGRAAGTGKVSLEDPRRFLAELMLGNQDTADLRPAILTIVGPMLAERLRSFGPVVPLLPGSGIAQLDRGNPQMLVIDRRALSSGVWAHVESGSGSGLLQELAEIIERCHALHIGTNLLDSGGGDGFYTSTLRMLCRNVFPLREDDLAPEGTNASELLLELQAWAGRGAAYAH